MWPDTSLTKLLNIHFPIIQAPMAGGATTPELVANVCNAGGLGSLGAAYMQPEAIRTAIKKIRELTDKPFSVNLFVPEEHSATEQQIEIMCNKLTQVCSSFMPRIEPVKPPFALPFDEQMAVIIEEKVPVFSFVFGMLSDHWLKQLKEINTIVIGTATQLTEAQLLANKNVDAIVAQGSEAGGHRGTFGNKAEDPLLSNFALLPLLSKYINKPIIAAGGIMDGRGIAAALMLGACGVQMGTAFLTCPEAGIHEDYKKLLLKSQPNTTVLTRVFSGKVARGLRNKFIDDLAECQELILDFPIQNALTKPIRDAAAKQNLTDYMSLWAGQACYLSRGIAADKLIEQLNREVESLLL